MFKRKIIRYQLEIDSVFLRAQLDKNQLVDFLFKGEEYLAFRRGNDYVAVKARCPHQNKPLLNAKCHEGYIICPFHNYHFSIKTGKGHGLSLEILELDFSDGGIYILYPKTSLF